VSGAADNRAYLGQELERLRLMLRRRALWVRHRLAADPLAEHRAAIVSDAQADSVAAGAERAAEAAFRRDDPQSGALGEQIRGADAALARSAAALADAGSPPAIDVLAARFGLAPLERDVLLLCLAPQIEPGFERLYAYLQDDVTRAYPTGHLAAALLAPPDDPAAVHAVLDRLAPDAPLRRYRLVTLAGGDELSPASRPLVLDDRVGDYLRGMNRPDLDVPLEPRPLDALPLSHDHELLVGQLGRWAAAEVSAGRWPALNLLGTPEVGADAVAVALSERLGLALRRLDLEALPPVGAERRDALRLIEREAALLRLAVYAEGREGAAAVSQLGALTIVSSEEPVELAPDGIAVRIPPVRAEDQSAMWIAAFGGAEAAPAGIERVVQQFDLGPRDIAGAAAAARARARLRDGSETARPEFDDVWQACRDRVGRRLDDLAQRIEPSSRWEDLVVPAELDRGLRELCSHVEQRAVVFGEWGFGQRITRGRGVAALFAGPSGTGKTMAAEVLAGYLQLELYRIDLAGVVSKYIGETEKNLRRIFDAAERSGAVLLFDEADALFGRRTDVKDSHDRYANIEVNYLLQRMEDYRGLAILATNRKAALDQAFLRRLRFVLDFPFPEVESRRAIWERALPPEAPRDDLDLDALSQLQIPGASIRSIALNAAFLAATEGTPIGTRHVRHAAQREYAKLDKLMTAAEFGGYPDPVPA
jgi:hypothetical protein